MMKNTPKTQEQQHEHHSNDDNDNDDDPIVRSTSILGLHEQQQQQQQQDEDEEHYEEHYEEDYHSLQSKHNHNNIIYKSIIILTTFIMCIALTSSLLRPYDVMIERKQRPLHLRKIFTSVSDYNSNGSFSFRDTFSGERIIPLFIENNNNNNNRVLNNNGNNGVYYDDAAMDDNGGGDDDGGTYYDDNGKDVDDFFRYIDDAIEIRQLFPLEVSDYVGMICTALSIILSVGGGIGPGSILVAVFIIVMDVQPKSAIPLSCMTGLGVAAVATGLNMRKRHPLSNRPLIDWDLVLIMEPLILFGAIAGTYVNKVLNQRVLIVLLVLLLSVVAHNTLKKARKMYTAEELYIKRILWAKQKKRNAEKPIMGKLTTVATFEEKLAEADPPFIPKVHSVSPLPKANDESRPQGDASSLPSDSSQSNSGFQSFFIYGDAASVKSSILEEEADPIPQHKITYIFTMFLGVTSFNVFKGGAGFESPLGISCGSFAFWVVELLTTIWLSICTLLAARYLLKRHAIKEAVGFDYVRGDIKWDVRTIVIYPAACVIAGLVSGIFGIGCGVLIAPMLVGIGVNPSVAAATCTCMNLFTNLAATSSFVVLGSLTIYQQYAVTFFFLGILSMLIGKWVVSYTMRSTKLIKNKRLERHSFMAYSMGLVVLVSALSMTVEALLDIFNHTFGDDEMDGICDVSLY